MSTAVCELRSTPAGEPLVPELVNVGDVIREEGDRTRYRVEDVAGPFGVGCYSVIAIDLDVYERRPDLGPGIRYWFNECVAVGRRILRLHPDDDRELFVISKGECHVSAKTKVPRLAQRKPHGRGTAAMPAIDEPDAIERDEFDSPSESPTLTDTRLADELQLIEWQEAKLECDLISRHPQNRDVPIPSVADLAESIRRTGRVLERVKVRDLGNGRYQMLSGERRWKAVQLILGWETIDADVAKMSDAAARALLTICNTQRQDLNDIEKAVDLQQLCMPVDRGGAGMTQEAAGDLYSMSQSHVANLIRLLAAPESLLKLVIAGEMPSSFLRVALPYLAIPGIDKAIAKEVAGWHKGRGEPGEKPSDRVPTRNEFHRDVRHIAERLTRPLTPAKADWWSEHSVQSERNRLFEMTDAVEADLKVIEIEMWCGKQSRATNVKLWDRLQKKAIPAAIAKWKSKKKQKADKSSKGATGSASATRTPAEQKKLDQQRAKQLAARINAWRHEWLLRLLVPQLDSMPLMVETTMTSLVFVEAGIAAATAELLRLRLDAPADDQITLPNLSRASVEAFARHFVIDVASEWSAMQQGTKPVEFEMFFLLHDKGQLEKLAGELKVNVHGIGTKKQLVARLIGQPRALPLPKSIATLGTSKKPRGKK